MTRFVTLFLATACLASCAARPWNGSSKFVAGLECGASEAQLQEYAKAFKGLTIKKGEGISSLVAQKKNTLIFLWSQSDRLEAYQTSWSYPLTNRAWDLKHNLCSGKQFVSLYLVGSPSLAGAKILLDENEAGELSDNGTMNLDVPLGAHQLLVRSSRGEWREELEYNQKSSGFDRREIRMPAVVEPES